MKLVRLRYFVAVAEELNFTRAAAKLRVAQPALSRQIRTLEHELEVELLERDGRAVELTPAGRVLFEEGSVIRRITLWRPSGRARPPTEIRPSE